MKDKKKNGWIEFVPSLDLPKERVSIAYDTHDERGVRYAYGYFQFYNGTCGCFWKDGNEQPKVVKAEDIKYWMPIPSLDVQEEPVSEDLDEAGKEWLRPQLDKSYANYGETKMMELTRFDGYAMLEAIEFGAKWKEKQMMKNVVLETEVLRDSDGDGVDTPYESWLTLANTDIPELPESLGFNEGDKVKIVIVKSE